MNSFIFLHPDASRSIFSRNYPLSFPARTKLIAVLTFFFRLLIVIDWINVSSFDYV
jgi:hypothetical protein